MMWGLYGTARPMCGDGEVARVSGIEPTTSSGDAYSHPPGRGECSMSVVLSDVLLFICVALFFTGIMIAGAILVG
jgi:hypothetical protein